MLLKYLIAFIVLRFFYFLFLNRQSIDFSLFHRIILLGAVPLYFIEILSNFF